jgi:hypothetical protein
MLYIPPLLLLFFFLITSSSSCQSTTRLRRRDDKSVLEDISMVLEGVTQEMDLIEPPILALAKENAGNVADRLAKERMKRYERIKEKWVYQNAKRIVRASIRGEKEIPGLTEFPVVDVVSDEEIGDTEDDLPSLASQRELVSRFRESLKKAERGVVTEEVQSDGTKVAVRTRDEGRIREAKEAEETASLVLKRAEKVKELTERLKTNIITDPEILKKLKQEVERVKGEAADAMRKQERFVSQDSSRSKIKLPAKLTESLDALGVQAKETIKALRQGREAEKAAQYADEAYKEAKQELSERAEKERLEEEEKEAEKAALNSKMSENEKKIREIETENAAMRETVDEKKGAVIAKKNELKALAKESEDLEKTLSEMKAAG